MDRTTRCLHCGKRLMPASVNGRTELRCIWCDKLDPLQTDAVKWAQSPLADAKPGLFSESDKAAADVVQAPLTASSDA